MQQRGTVDEATVSMLDEKSIFSVPVSLSGKVEVAVDTKSNDLQGSEKLAAEVRVRGTLRLEVLIRYIGSVGWHRFAIALTILLARFADSQIVDANFWIYRTYNLIFFVTVLQFLG
jgi:hypothetical protein